jgi:glycolate oxidase FAD binding subunit
MAPSSLVTRLSEAVGTDRVKSAPEDLVAYCVDGLSPAAIVRPASLAEALETVKFVLAEKIKVLPLGSRSKCNMGMAPARYDIALDMTAMREIAHYDAGDMTLSIDAGTSLRELDVFLKPHGQFLPLAVPCFETTTAGGAIASGIDSVLRQQYGTARDFLLGAEFIDGRGQLCKSGGRVVKNVTGYDLHKLLIGSLGTLGVITRLNFRTFPLPAVTSGYIAAFDSGSPAMDFRHHLEHAGVPLTNLEVLSPAVIKMIRAILEKSADPPPAAIKNAEWCVYAAFEGSETVVKRISGELEKFARGTGARQFAMLETGADQTLGGMLREAFEWLRWAAKATVLYRLAVCGEPGVVMVELARTAESLGLRSALLLRSMGIIYFAFFSDHESELIGPAQKIDTVLTALASAQGGHATLLHAPLKAKLKIAEARGERSDKMMHQRVKNAFDPSGVLVPGRVVGGI